MQNHAAKTQDTWVDAVEKTEVVEIEHAVSRARNRLRAATTKKFDTKETFQLESIVHGQVAEKQQVASKDAKESMVAMTAAELVEKSGLRNLRHRQ